MLFSEFWHESELCIMFADTNIGKSLLAVQIGDSLSSGKPIQGFKMGALAVAGAETQERMEGDEEVVESGHAVLYFDFELSDKQFESRYSDNYTNHYVFSHKFKRLETKQGALVPGDVRFEDYIVNCLEEEIVRYNARTIIVDNITYMRTQFNKTTEALSLMKRLTALKRRFNLNILVLAHTPKRDARRPLSINDLQGSKMLMNFCDSAFAIGKSVVRGPNHEIYCYLKQIKQRNTEQVYGADKLCVCKINKAHNFLQMEFVGYGVEAEHLAFAAPIDKENLELRIKEILEIEPGISQYAIAKRLYTGQGNFNSFARRVYRALNAKHEGEGIPSQPLKSSGNNA